MRAESRFSSRPDRDGILELTDVETEAENEILFISDWNVIRMGPTSSDHAHTRHCSRNEGLMRHGMTLGQPRAYEIM